MTDEKVLAEARSRLAGQRVVMSEGDCWTLVRQEGLDAAWAEAEAALPEGWRGPKLRRSYDFPDQYWALAEQDPGDRFREGYGPTPAEAIRALARFLRGDDQ